MESLISYFECGRYNEDSGQFIVTKFEDLTNIIIPFFGKYPILSSGGPEGTGVKAKDFSDFCTVAELMKNKTHLTKEGLEKIRFIKSGMNTGR
jgi:hypothetical protein